jgi:hypothetical protein
LRARSAHPTLSLIQITWLEVFAPPQLNQV